MAEADLPVPTGMACAALPILRLPRGRQGGARSRRHAAGREALRPDHARGGRRGREGDHDAPRERGRRRAHHAAAAGARSTNACELTLALRSGKTALQQTVAVPAARPYEVYYVLMHSHVDIGYTDIQPHIAAKQAQNVDPRAGVDPRDEGLSAGARFKWKLEVMWTADQFLQGRHARTETGVRPGGPRTAASAWTRVRQPADRHLARGEEMVRQNGFATDLGRRCGVTVDSMMISDVPGLTGAWCRRWPRQA